MDVIFTIVSRNYAAQAATVTGIKVEHRDGQTFVTWDNLPGNGWLYHVLSAGVPIVDDLSLENAVELAQVGSQSAVDQRISRVYLTAAGRAVRSEMMVALGTLEAETFAGLDGAELDHLRGLLERLRANLRRVVGDQGAR